MLRGPEPEALADLRRDFNERGDGRVVVCGSPRMVTHPQTRVDLRRDIPA